MKKYLLIIILTSLPVFGFGQFPNHNWNDCPRNDIAHDQNFITRSNASVGEKIGRLNWNINNDTLSSIVYSEITDTSNLFGINGDSVYLSSVTGLQKSKIYYIQFKVTDGIKSDTAGGYIYIADSDSLIHWNNNYSSFSAGYYYYFNRGSTYSLTSEIYIDADNITFMAIGNGNYPILKPTGTQDDIFDIFNYNNGFTIQDLEIQKNNNGYVWNCFNLNRATTNFTSNNNRIIGSDVNYPNDAWWHIYHLNDLYLSQRGLLHKITDNYVTGCFGSVSWYSLIDDVELIGNFHRELGLGEIGGDPSGVGGISNGFDFSNDADNYCTKVDCRYNRIDHSTQPYKYGLQIGGGGLTVFTYDTVKNNRIIGPGKLNGNLDYTFNGIAANMNSKIYIAENRIDSVENGFCVAGLAAKHITFENNLVIGARVFGILFLETVDSSLIIHNTFTDPGFSDIYYVFGGDFTNKDTIANNIIDVSDGQSIYQVLDPVRIYNLYSDLTGTGYTLTATEIESNPLFTNKTELDFTLQSESPCIDTGYDFGLVYDFVGNLRSAIPDIGAYEYIEEPLGKYIRGNKVYRFPGGNKIIRN